MGDWRPPQFDDDDGGGGGWWATTTQNRTRLHQRDRHVIRQLEPPHRGLHTRSLSYTSAHFFHSTPKHTHIGAYIDYSTAPLLRVVSSRLSPLPILNVCVCVLCASLPHKRKQWPLRRDQPARSIASNKSTDRPPAGNKSPFVLMKLRGSGSRIIRAPKCPHPVEWPSICSTILVTTVE